MENSDDDIHLCKETQDILNAFLAEKAEREKMEEEYINTQNNQDLSFEENWQLSQFWYNEKTKSDLTNLIRKLLTSTENQIGLLSCPSLFNCVKKAHENTKIFEFDKRFSAFGDDFIFYDYNEGTNPDYLLEYKKYFDIIIVDPPFLSEECIEKISQIVERISKENVKIIFCSGEIVESWLKKYLNLKKFLYRPQHERNLGNEFVSYANFNLDELLD